MYRLLSIGVNNGLKYAEKDAADVHRFFTGGAGPLRDEQATLLVGRGATVAQVAEELGRLAQAAPDLLVLYFSGHGGTGGIQLADGKLPYEYLAAALRRLRGSRAVVILDTCRAGSFRRYLQQDKIAGLGALPDKRWQELLAAAAPGARIYYSVPADKLSREGDGVENGHFTAAFLAGLTYARGDLDGYVSDRAAFVAARAVMREHWPHDPLPEASGIGGDLPLAISQAPAPVGTATLPWVRLLRGSTSLGLRLGCDGRRHLPTRLEVALCDAQGNIISLREDQLSPGFDRTEFELEVPLDRRRVLAYRPIRRALQGAGAWLRWEVRVYDEHDRVLAAESVVERYQAA